MKEKALRETQIRSMHEVGEMKRAQELRVDEVSVQKLRENHETIQKLTSQLQEIQEQMNSMNDSGEFQEVESNYSGRLSYVCSQPAMIPSSRSMLSRHKCLPLYTWNTSGLQENVLGNQYSTLDSRRDHPQGIHSGAPQRERGSVPQAAGSETLFARNDKQNRGTNPMPTFAGRPSTMSSAIPVDFPKNSVVGQQRQQMSQLQFDKFLNPRSFLVWMIRFKNQVTTCSDFPSDAMLWIKEVEMVDSLEELKSSRSASGKNFPNFEMLDAKIASALNKIIQNVSSVQTRHGQARVTCTSNRSQACLPSRAGSQRTRWSVVLVSHSHHKTSPCASGTLTEDIISEWEQRKKSRAGRGAPCKSRKTVFCVAIPVMIRLQRGCWATSRRRRSRRALQVCFS